MAEKQPPIDAELPRTLLSRLEKLEPKQEGRGGRRNDFRFERNVLTGAGMTHEREVEIVRELAADEWSEVETPPEAPGS